MLKVENLNKAYGKEKVLHNVNIHIKTGEIVTIVGSSGSGKTTLLRVISGLEFPDSGRIVIKDNETQSIIHFVKIYIVFYSHILSLHILIKFVMTQD